MRDRVRAIAGCLILILSLTACPADPPEIIVATATGQPASADASAANPRDRDHPAPALSTVANGSLQFTISAFQRPVEMAFSEAPPDSEIARLDLRVVCLEDNHCELTISEFQLLSADHNYLPIEDLPVAGGLQAGPMSAGQVQDSILFYHAPVAVADLIFHYSPLDNLWADTVYMALP